MCVLKKIKWIYVVLAALIAITAGTSVYAGVSAKRIDQELELLKKQEWVIPLGKYEQISVIEGAKGLYAAGSEKEIGLIDAQGKVMLPEKYQAFNPVCVNDRILVVQNGLTGYVDQEGKEVIAPQYDAGYPFRNGYASVKKDGIRKIVDPQGKVMFECRSAEDGSDELYPSNKEDCIIMQSKPDEESGTRQIRVINVKSGQTLFNSDEYAYLDDYSEGFWSAQTGSGYVLLNEDFQPVKEMEEAAAFHEGLAKIKAGKTLTYINKEGKAVIKKEAELGSDFSEGIACIIRQQKGIFFDQEGNTLFTVPCYRRGGFADPEYPVGFQDGYCLWRGENGKYGYLDHEGKYVVPPCLDQAGAVNQGEAEVTYGKQSGVLKLPAR